MDTESAARVCLHVSWSRWASTRLGPVSLVPHLLSQSSEPQEQEENIFVLPSPGVVGFLRQSLDIC